MTYKVILSTEVSQAIDSIHDYITTVLLLSQSAKNTVVKILDGLKSLETFPETGFDADEKIGLKINSKYPTRGKVIGQYILLYFIDQTQKNFALSIASQWFLEYKVFSCLKNRKYIY